MTNQSSNESLSLEFNDQLDPQLEMEILYGINAHANQKKGMEEIHLFSVSLRNKEGSLLGGLTGMLCYGCLHIDMLWISDAVRGQGWGRKIVEEAERQAQKRGCHFSTLETMDWEALPFYKKLGYTIEFTRIGYERNSTMYLLRKEYITAHIADTKNRASSDTP